MSTYRRRLAEEFKGNIEEKPTLNNKQEPQKKTINELNELNEDKKEKHSSKKKHNSQDTIEI